MAARLCIVPNCWRSTSYRSGNSRFSNRFERKIVQDLRQQQDEAYEESLRADQEKERQKQLERERLLQLQRQEEAEELERQRLKEVRASMQKSFATHF